MTLATRVQAYLRAAAAAGEATTEAGGFAVKLRADTPSPFANYAMPLAPDGLDVAALPAVFAGAERTPRLEWVAEFAPELEAAVLAAGFALELRTPVMTCAPSKRSEPPPVAGLSLHDVGPDAPDTLLRELVAVQEEGFGAEDVTVSDEDVARTRRIIAAGALGRLDGEPAGGGALNALVDGVSEVVGVATRPAYRRRGIAAQVVGALARQGFALGAELLVLTPGDAGAQRLYGRAGFVPRLTMLHYRVT